MSSFPKLIACAFVTSLAVAPAFAQIDNVGDGRQQLAALRQQEASVRQRIGQLQLDALIARLGRPATTGRQLPAAPRPLTPAATPRTIADLLL